MFWLLYISLHQPANANFNPPPLKPLPKKGPKKAIVAIARKLLVVIWNVLTAQAADRRAEPELVAKYLMNWASQHRLSNQHLGIRRPLFVRQQLDRLGIGQDLQGFKWGSTYFKLPPSSLIAQSPQPTTA